MVGKSSGMDMIIWKTCVKITWAILDLSKS
ncbi:hypothetical protein Patl1_32095 [Pistacia atlantica]|uniref:Uncharacterized protein n=1 Tax=Pistacia atlantica TaxID=434234 RepID=A0ACC1AQ36_9ROSI|nr:hypothetical protein Patl1_32095 [Pistacia atlantica]